MTFCRYWETCKKGGDCHRALTDEVVANAARAKLPISQFADEPDCYEEAPND